MSEGHVIYSFPAADVITKQGVALKQPLPIKGTGKLHKRWRQKHIKKKAQNYATQEVFKPTPQFRAHSLSRWLPTPL
ncbi:hypothetical protein SKAU_G00250730 [Synaphobranchus kaupii]|uniref:Uncharacterized protein n=1 Tax=Synaphobranchus kaupii TaxID=118154 RepID=A0A9Q1IRK6_SYNKA|nr:hypothetical protein SKAU_G00250730 [Synaphobranchus kaupii]